MASDGIEAKLEDAVPVFLVADIAATMRWYQTVLGFSGRALPEQPPHVFGILNRDAVTIFLQQLDGYRKPDLYERRAGGVWSVYLETRDVRAFYDVLAERPDVEILEPLEHQEYGQTEFVVRDPNGYALVFAEPD